MRKIYYLLNNGKNSNLTYFAHNYLREIIPNSLYRMRLKHWLNKLEQRPDKEYILQRVNYYCHLTSEYGYDHDKWLNKSVELRHQQIAPKKVYYFDAKEIARYFPDYLRWILLKGDITHVPEVPVIVKSRPLGVDITNSTLLKLEKVRHFLFVNDTTTWHEKENLAIFRGELGGPRKVNRKIFMERWFGDSQIDAGSTNVIEGHTEWLRPKLTISEHFKYKFIMSLEGNDVASNLKWVMSSNSIAVTPKPTCETWFMEGTLIPNYHYIEVKEDFSDLKERLDYYIKHTDEAETIIKHAHEYIDQFKDAEREKLIQILVLKRYLELTNNWSIDNL